MGPDGRRLTGPSFTQQPVRFRAGTDFSKLRIPIGYAEYAKDSFFCGVFKYK